MKQTGPNSSPFYRLFHEDFFNIHVCVCVHNKCSLYCPANLRPLHICKRAYRILCYNEYTEGALN